MKNTTSLKRRLLLSKNFILMIVMLVVIILAISAWFTVNKTVTANEMNVVAASNEINIAPCIKTYDSGWNVLTDGPGVFDSKITFTGVSFTKDCTGDGTNLIVPEFNVTKDSESVRLNGGKEVNTNLSPVDAKSSQQAEIELKKNPGQEAAPYEYAEFEFYVRSKNKNLLLDSASQLLAQTEVDGHSLSDISYTKSESEATVDKKSSYGSLNVDGLVGAMRVSLLAEGCSSVDQTWKNGELVTKGNSAPNSVRERMVKQLLWLPRPDVFLEVSPKPENITEWQLHTGVTQNQENGVTYAHTYYKRDTQNGGITLETANAQDDKLVVSSGSGSHSVPCLGSDCNITDFSDYSTQPPQINLVANAADVSVTYPYYVTKFTMRVWIEGTDTEARRAMDGGKFNLTLKFK